jgi:hypothetical protein
MIIAACLIEGIDRLYSEDFDSYSEIGSRQIINPFKLRQATGNRPELGPPGVRNCGENVDLCGVLRSVSP